MKAARGFGIQDPELGVERGPAVAPGAAHDLGADLGVRARRGLQPLEEDADVKTGAAHDDRAPARAAISAMARSASLANAAASYGWSGATTLSMWCATPPSSSGRGVAVP
ncbi:hypothetical protein LDC_0505, partial [sediment metagenome]